MRAQRWQLRPVVVLRIAGLPLETLDGLDLAQSAALVDELCDLAAATDERRVLAIDILYELGGRGSDLALRNAALEAKRRLFNAKPLRRVDLEQPWPAEVAEALDSIAARQQQHEELERRLEEVVEVERRQISQRLRAQLGHPRLLGGMLLSSRDHFEVARGLAALVDDDHHPAARAVREATVARYLLRATTRTTPFSSFAAVALLRVDPNGARHEPVSPTWVHTPQLDAGVLGARILADLDPKTQRGLTLRITPLHWMVATPTPHLVFLRYLVAADGNATCEWNRLELSRGIAELLQAVEGRTAAQAIDRLESSHATPIDWQAALDALLAAGLVEPRLPAQLPTTTGLTCLAAELRALGDERCARRLHVVSTALDRYARAPIDQRVELLERIAKTVGDPPRRSHVLEDCSVHGLELTDLPLSVEALAHELEPAAALARACATDVQHQVVVEAFCQQFGPSGRCDDVPGFLTMLLMDPALTARLRTVEAALPWRTSALGLALEQHGDDPLVLAPELFGDLPGSDAPCSIAAFVQLAVRHSTGAASVEHIVLNGLQSGRDKYVSRYLADPALHAEPLAAVRACFDTAAEPIPVSVVAGLGLNFQLHPPLTRWRLDAPLEACPTSQATLSLDELVLTFDAQQRRLRLYAPRLGRDIEPVHLGFLRDQLLPDPLLVIRALSPRIGDETIAERASLYGTLDAADLLGGSGLRRFRPRVSTGRLVLERARWAVPCREVPRKAAREPYARYFARLERWRRDQDLPRRGFVRRLSGRGYLRDLAKSQQYMDWHNPLCLGNLRRLLGDEPDDRWLVLTELLPTPEQAHLVLDGQRHCAELVVQLDWSPA